MVTLGTNINTRFSTQANATMTAAEQFGALLLARMPIADLVAGIGTTMVRATPLARLSALRIHFPVHAINFHCAFVDLRVPQTHTLHCNLFSVQTFQCDGICTWLVDAIGVATFRTLPLAEVSTS